MLVLDLPADADAATAVRTTDRVHAARERVAAYSPWLLVGGRAVPPSGAVAGVLARVDATDGVWSSPSGGRGALLGVEGAIADLDDRDAERLSAGGINPVRVVAGGHPLKLNARAAGPLAVGTSVFVVEMPTESSVVVVETTAIP